jgi:MFS family permease
MAASSRERNTSLAITALCSVQFVDVLGVTVVVTALPRMLADLNAPASAGGLLMLGARLGDRFGHRRTITASLAVLAAGALLGAVAGSIVLLTAARCLQGAAAAASVPSALRLLTTLTPGINTAAQLGTATGIAAMLLVAAVTSGPPGPGTGAPVIAWAAARQPPQPEH